MDVFIRFANRPRCFAGPEQILQCHEPGELPAAFAAMERALARGRHLAGFLAYEAGYAFEPCLRALCPQRDYPLLQFGIYGPPRQTMPVPRPDNPFIARSFSFLLDRPAYNQRITAIRRHIARGDVYQVTFCNKLRFNWQGDPVHALHDLHARQPVPYAAYVRDDSQTIVSLSPERFLVKQGTRLLTEPMKGTWPRGETRAADRAARQSFARDAKNRAENIMIADLLRNDLGRIGHTVRAPKLCTITPYRTLFQMTSTVTARCARTLPLCELFAALFPSGSVTGAPKIMAMEIIRELEPEPRHIYTGAIGWITPQRDLYFNVPIRTLLLRGTCGEMGVGGGIVWDSTADGEWAEQVLKAGFLTGPLPG